MPRDDTGQRSAVPGAARCEFGSALRRVRVAKSIRSQLYGNQSNEYGPRDAEVYGIAVVGSSQTDVGGVLA